MRIRIVVAAVAGIVTAALAVLSHRGAAFGRRLPGGIVMNNVAAYDVMTRLLLGPLYRSIASDVAAVASPEARVLDVGCGSGTLATRLARDHGLDVTGVDLDPVMVERATANAFRKDETGRRPSFVVGDVAALPFPDDSFDLVVSTLSMHHWDDPAAGLADIARVLRPGGRALVWDFGRGMVPFHGHMPDPAQRMHGASIRLVSVQPWRWPWRFTLADRIELAP